MWAKIEEQQGIKTPQEGTKPWSHVAQPPSENLEIAAATIEEVSMMLEQMVGEIEANFQREIDEVDGMEARKDHRFISKIESNFDEYDEDELHDNEI